MTHNKSTPPGHKNLAGQSDKPKVESVGQKTTDPNASCIPSAPNTLLEGV